MNAAAQEVARLEAELAAAQKKLTERASMPVKRVIATLAYDKAQSGSIQVTGNFDAFVKGPDLYTLGTADLAMEDFCRAKTLDLSALFVSLWDAQWAAPNILLRVTKFLEGKWDELATYDLFKLPIDLKKKAKGNNKCDLPNVSFAITTLMLRRGIEFVVVDPIHHGTDRSVRIVNYSEALRSLQGNISKRIHTPFDFGPSCSKDALQIVLFQYGSGQPKPNDEQEIENTTGFRGNIVRVKLAPGKYDRGICTWGSCYSTFKDSNAMILHELSILDQFTQSMNKRMLHKVFFVLDPFSAYAASTAVAIAAYGLDPVAEVLCYHKGKYTAMPVLPRA